MAELKSKEGLPKKSPAKKNSAKKWIFCGLAMPVVAGFGLVGLIGLYYLSGYIIVKSIESSYSAANCDPVLTFAGPVKSIFPVNLVPFIEPSQDLVIECEEYAAAVQYQEQGNWSDAYEGFRVFLNDYPDSELEDDVKGRISRDTATSHLITVLRSQKTGTRINTETHGFFCFFGRFRGKPVETASILRREIGYSGPEYQTV